MHFLQKQLAYKDLLWEFVKTDFKMRYNDSVLGVIWVLLKPFLLFSILYIVFSYMFLVHDPQYRLNLLLGLILFSYFSEGTTRGMNSLLDRAQIILKVNFPRHIAVLASVINSTISFFFSVAIFLIFWLFSPTPITGWYILFPVYVFIFFLLILGFSYFASILVVKFRDLGAIWEVLLSAFFYLTPIIYPLALVPERLQRILMLNPIAAVVRDLRFILVQGAVPGVYSIMYLILLGVLTSIAGYFFFRANVMKISEKI